MFVASLFAASVTPAFACSWPDPPPEQKYREHPIVVLAYPVSITTSPERAMTRGFEGAFVQSIQWQVLVRWKGPFKVGDVFLSMQPYRTSVCGTGAVYDKAVQLLYLDGTQPFRDFIHGRPDERLDEMKHLERQRRGP